jgi:hypothetical protein
MVMTAQLTCTRQRVKDNELARARLATGELVARQPAKAYTTREGVGAPGLARQRRRAYSRRLLRPEQVVADQHCGSGNCEQDTEADGLGPAAYGFPDRPSYFADDFVHLSPPLNVAARPDTGQSPGFGHEKTPIRYSKRGSSALDYSISMTLDKGSAEVVLTPTSLVVSAGEEVCAVRLIGRPTNASPHNDIHSTLNGQARIKKDLSYIRSANDYLLQNCANGRRGLASAPSTARSAYASTSPRSSMPGTARQRAQAGCPR